jgi:hypothetical protein
MERQPQQKCGRFSSRPVIRRDVRLLMLQEACVPMPNEICFAIIFENFVSLYFLSDVVDLNRLTRLESTGATCTRAIGAPA